MRISMRLAWAAMLFLHGYWLAKSVVYSTAGVGSQLALVAAIAFFALKTIDLPLLRVELTRRNLVASLLIVALLHTGVIDRSLDSELTMTFWALPLLASLPVCMKLTLRGWIRHLLRFAAYIGHVPLTWTRSYWHRYGGDLIARHQHYLLTTLPCRAPPA